MQRHGEPGDGTPSLESLGELRLRALLNDLVNDLGQVKAAEELGIDRKTLWRNEGAGQMSARLIEALERMLLERAVAAMEEDRETVRALEERVGELERQLTAAPDTAGSGNGGDGSVVEASGRSGPRTCAGWSGGWNGWSQCGAAVTRPAGPGRDGPGPSGVTPTW